MSNGVESFPSEPISEQAAVNYDSWPLEGGVVREAVLAEGNKYHWRVPIEQLTLDERNKRILESPMEYILETCGKYPPLDKEEEYDLLRKYQAGDIEAKGTVILHSLRFVVYVAKQVRRKLNLSPETMASLVHSGVIGLSHAIDNFDLEDERHVKLTSYAYQGIHWEMYRDQDYYGDDKTIRLPVHVQVRLRAIRRARKILDTELGHEPTEEELADFLGMDTVDLRTTLASTRQPLSLDAYVAKDDEGEWVPRHNMVSESEDAVAEELLEKNRLVELGVLLERLSFRSRTLLGIRFGLRGRHDSSTFDEAGSLFNITRERVRQIENRALMDSRELGRLLGLSIAQGEPKYITPEDEQRRHQVSRVGGRPRSYGEYLAHMVRTHTIAVEREKNMTALERWKMERAQQRHAARLQQIDRDYEALMEQRAYGAVDEASGQLPTRTEYFKQHYETAEFLLTDQVHDGWSPQFRHEFGILTTQTAQTLYGGLEALTASNKQAVTLLRLQEHIETYDGSLFSLRSEFLAATLAAMEQAGVVVVDRNGQAALYRLRQADEQIPPIIERDPKRERLPKYAGEVLEVIADLKTGTHEDTAITFGRLRREWAEKTYDVDETSLRLAMTYLLRAQAIAVGKDKIRGHYLWLTPQEQAVHPKVKPSELWYEDLNG